MTLAVRGRADEEPSKHGVTAVPLLGLDRWSEAPLGKLRELRVPVRSGIVVDLRRGVDFRVSGTQATWTIKERERVQRQIPTILKVRIRGIALTSLQADQLCRAQVKKTTKAAGSSPHMAISACPPKSCFRLELNRSYLDCLLTTFLTGANAEAAPRLNNRATTDRRGAIVSCVEVEGKCLLKKDREREREATRRDPYNNFSDVDWCRSMARP